VTGRGVRWHCGTEVASARAGVTIRARLVALVLLLPMGCGSSSPSGPALVEPPGKRRRIAPVEFFCTTRQVEICANARDDNCNGTLDEGCELATGLVQFVIAWNQAPADVDLIVSDPRGEIAEVGKSTGSGLIKDRDCPGKNQDCQGRNLENVFLDSQRHPLRGSYSATIRLESLQGLDEPIVVDLYVRLGREQHQGSVSLLRAEQAETFHFEL
jgi:hypothetical protein